MSRESELTIGLALVIAMGCGVSNAAAQTDKYPRMAAIGQYLMEKNAEIQLARSAAPDSISRDATILVLGRQGYETAVAGKNGFICMVARGWMAAFDWPEFWNPKVRAADCMKPPGCTFRIADRFSTQQDGDGRSFQGGDPIGNQSGVREQTTAGPRERRDGLHDVEIGLSDRRGRPQRTSSDVLYCRHGR